MIESEGPPWPLCFFLIIKIGTKTYAHYQSDAVRWTVDHGIPAVEIYIEDLAKETPDQTLTLLANFLGFEPDKPGHAKAGMHHLHSPPPPPPALTMASDVSGVAGVVDSSDYNYYGKNGSSFQTPLEVSHALTTLDNWRELWAALVAERLDHYVLHALGS